MHEKKTTISKSSIIVLLAFLTIATIFFLYELVFIGNPFMDPMQPNILWGLLVFVSFGFAYRLFSISKGK